MLTVVAVCALVIGLLGLLAGILALRTLGRLRRSVGLLGRGGGDRESFLEVSARHVELTEQNRRELADLRGRVEGGLERGDPAGQIAALRSRIDVELAALADRVTSAGDSFHAEIRAERADLAADHSAARDQIRGALDRVEKALSTSVRRSALVRFDAFDDLGGRLSFCLVLLDGRGDGIALTSLAGRSDTRLYAKPITAGVATTDLTPEERQAVSAALAV